MSNRAESAIELIFEINEKFSTLMERIEIIDKNIKSLNNKFIILTKKIDKLEEKQSTQVISQSFASSGSKPSSKAISNETTNSKLVLGSIKTYGYIVNEEHKPIPGVDVLLYSEGLKIRDLKTDKDGYWEARLSQGDYTVIYSHKMFKDVEKTFTLSSSEKTFEVF